VTVRSGAPRQVLVCDREPQIVRALRSLLRPHGFGVVATATGEEALAAAAEHAPHAAILELVLPDLDGVELCRRLRERSDMSIIVLSAVADEASKVRALRAGADDYVTKPFGPDELVARLEAALRRSAPQPAETVIRADGLEVDLAAHVVRRNGEEVHLTPTEFEVLRALIRNRGQLMTHRALVGEVWGRELGGEPTVLRGQIANLRRKIEPRGGPWRYIRTASGVGYRFVGHGAGR
jgi:two-component system KDP operon response regulator KdpE